MTENDRHGSREQKIFSLFAEVCGLAIQLDSIEKRKPPEPDILCQIAGEGTVTFEMVELTRARGRRALMKLVGCREIRMERRPWCRTSDQPPPRDGHRK